MGISYAGPDPLGHGTVTINYNFPNTENSPRQVTFSVDDNGKLAINPQESSGTWEFAWDVTCMTTGTHTFMAAARACDGDNRYQSSASTAVVVNTTPAVSVSAGAPDPGGDTVVTVTYTFPNTDERRELTLQVDGAHVGSLQSPALNGTWEHHLDFTCRGSGPHTITARAMACGGGDDGFIATGSTAANLNMKPTVSPTKAGPDGNGIDLVNIEYSFPNTNTPLQRNLFYLVDGVFAGVLPTPENSGTWLVSTHSACWQTLKAVAFSCGQNVPENRAEQELHAQEKEQSISVFQVKDGLNGDGNVVLKGKVTWELAAAGGTIHLRALRWVGGDGAVHEGFDLPDIPVTQKSGSAEFTVSPPAGARQVIVEATAADACGTVKGEGALDCATCTAASNDPVQFSDGNLSLSETDPLPPIGGHPLTRTYNSDEQVVGLFGRGWTSIFERRLFTDTGAVMIVTDDNQVLLFRPDGSGYRQAWPKARREHGSLVHDPSAGLYRYRAAGSTEVSVFRASDGRLSSVRDDAHARNAVIGYDTAGVPSSFSDAMTEVRWNLTVDAATRTITQIAVAGHPELVWTYAHDAQGNLTGVTSPEGAWRTYQYDANRMTASYDALGNLMESHDFDSEGFATNSTGPSDEIASIEYNLPGPVAGERLTRVTYKTGAVAEYRLRPSGGVLRPVRISGGCSTCGTLEATYVYDSRGRVVREQGADGYITVTSYLGDLVASEETSLAPSGCDPSTDVHQCRLESEALEAAALMPTSATMTTSYEHTDPLWPDRVTAVERASVRAPGQTRREEYTWHATTGALMTTRIVGWTGTPAAATERLTHTAFYEIATSAPAFNPGGSFPTAWMSLPQPDGLRKSIDGPRSDAQDVSSFVSYPLDASVPPLLRGRLAATKNAAGLITRFEDYDVFGNATRMVDANGVATELSFDALGRLVTSTLKAVAGCNITLDPLCATDLTSTRDYFGAGPASVEHRPAGGVTAYTYDGRGRMVTTSRGPAEGDYPERIETTYDVLTGKRSVEKTLAYESGSWVEKRRESYAYDGRARLQTVTHADGAKAHYAYDAAGRMSSVRDENHAAPNTFYSYDPAGRLSSVRQTLAGAPGGAITTRYAYDLHGNLVSVTDPNGNATTYVYDDFGQMLEQASPVTGSTRYEYDEAGNLTQMTDANGAVTERTYDAASRALNAVSTRAGESETVSWTYDDATAGAHGLGRLASMAYPGGTTAYAYERRGYLRRETRTMDGTTFVQTYGYDADGDRNAIGYPSGRVVTYGLDFAGRPLTATGSMSGQTTPYVTGATYLPFGPVTSLALGNATVESRTYDTRYQPLTNILRSGATTLAHYNYTNDPAGNITGIADATNAGYSRTFGYDDLHRLINASTGASLWGSGSFTYDAMGNRLTETLGIRHRSFTYQGTTPKIATATGLPAAMTYDAVGNELDSPAGQPGDGPAAIYSPRNLLTSQLVRKYDRCAEEHLDCVQADPVEVWQSNVYDGRGVRVQSTQTIVASSIDINAPPPPTSVYFYTPELAMLNLVAPSTGRTADVIWFGSRPVADHESSTVRYTFTDHLGTPILQTTPTATIIWRAEYEPFGNMYLLRAGTVADDQPLRFPGQQVSYGTAAGEENYNIFRWYRGGWGRYTQVDRFGLATDINLYRYADNNPIMEYDPFGLFAQLMCRPVDLKDAGAVIGAIVKGLAAPVHCRLRVMCCDPKFDLTVGLEWKGKNSAGKSIYKITTESVPQKGWGTSPVWGYNSEDCQFEKCVLKNAKVWDPPPYSLMGPNSNTFVKKLLDHCGGSTYFPSNAIGWNAD